MADMPQGRDFRVPPVIHVGEGALTRLPETLVDLGIQRAVLVTDRVLAGGPWMPRLHAYATEAEVELTVDDALTAEPTTDDVDHALGQIRASNADGVIAFGGGSAIDTAKSAAILAVNPGTLPDYEGYERIPRAGPSGHCHSHNRRHWRRSHAGRRRRRPYPRRQDAGHERAARARGRHCRPGPDRQHASWCHRLHGARRAHARH